MPYKYKVQRHPQLSFLRRYLPFFLETGLLTDLELTEQAKLTF